MLFENSEISINNFRKIRLIIGNINITYIADFSKNISYNIVNDNMFNLAEEYADSKKSSSATLVYAKYIEWYHKIFISLNDIIQNT